MLPTPDVLRVTVPLEMGLHVLPDVLVELRTAFPDVLVEAHAESRRAALAEEDFDVAVRLGVLADSSYLARRLGSLELLLVAPPALARAVDGPDALQAAPRVEILGIPRSLSGTWSGVPFSVHPEPVARVSTFTSALRMVVAGAGFAVVPAYAASEALDRERVVAIDAVELPRVPVHALYPPRHRGQAVVTGLLDRLQVRLSA